MEPPKVHKFHPVYHHNRWYENLDAVCRAIINDVYLDHQPKPELIENKRFWFGCVDYKHQFHGWSIQGKILKAFPPYSKLDLNDVITYYRIADGRVYHRLARAIDFARFAIEADNGQRHVVVMDPSIILMRCLNP